MTSAGKLRPSQGFLLGWEEKLLFQGVWLILQKNTLGLQATLFMVTWRKFIGSRSESSQVTELQPRTGQKKGSGDNI